MAALTVVVIAFTRCEGLDASMIDKPRDFAQPCMHRSPDPHGGNLTVPSTRFLPAVLVLTTGIACTTVAHADLDAAGQREVQALLDFVGHSHCSFIRNGKAYDGDAARSHLEYKLNYLLERHRVNSAEEFIQRAATESSFSGKPYRVNCDGNERTSAEWLMEELRRMRATGP